MGGLTETQSKALAITPKVTGLLSMCGSLFIILSIFTSKTNATWRVYHRILLAMSIFDICTSFWFFMSTWPIPPEGAGDVYGAVGSTPFCTVQGFFIQLGLVVPFYNACLSINYLCTIRLEMSEEQLKKYEPWMHVGAIVFPLSTAIAGLPLTLYNSANLWCWIDKYPLDCNSKYDPGTGGACERGRNAYVYQWALFYIPLWLLIAFVGTVMILVYLKVRNQEDKVTKYVSGGDRSKSKAVAKQAFLYVAAFCMTWLFGTINRAYQVATHGSSLFVLLYLHSFFVPLQGFFNCLVYVRPRYKNFVKDHPQLGYCARFFDASMYTQCFRANDDDDDSDPSPSKKLITRLTKGFQSSRQPTEDTEAETRQNCSNNDSLLVDVINEHLETNGDHTQQQQQQQQQQVKKKVQTNASTMVEMATMQEHDDEDQEDTGDNIAERNENNVQVALS